MEYRPLGESEIDLSEVGFGCGDNAGLMMSGTAEERSAAIARALELGINYFDTAAHYGDTLSETNLGLALHDLKARPIIATKVRLLESELADIPGAITRSLEGSLSRLQVAGVDILYLHHWDEHTDLEITLSALNDLVVQGKVLHVAVSNFAAWQCAKAIQILNQRGWAPVTAIQPMYSLIKRVAEIEILVTTLANQMWDLQQFKSFGIDPESKRVVALKSMQHFRADFEPIAGRVIVCDSGALCTPCYQRLDYRNVVRPIFPLDQEFEV